MAGVGGIGGVGGVGRVGGWSVCEGEGEDIGVASIERDTSNTRSTRGGRSGRGARVPSVSGDRDRWTVCCSVALLVCWAAGLLGCWSDMSGVASSRSTQQSAEKAYRQNKNNQPTTTNKLIVPEPETRRKESGESIKSVGMDGDAHLFTCVRYYLCCRVSSRVELCILSFAFKPKIIIQI